METAVVSEDSSAQWQQVVKPEETEMTAQDLKQCARDGNERLIFPASFLQTASYHHWCHVGITHQLQSDVEIICFLLKCYDQSAGKIPADEAVCKSCHSPLKLECINCSKNRKPERDGTTAHGDGSCQLGGPQKGQDQQDLTADSSASGDQQRDTRSSPLDESLPHLNSDTDEEVLHESLRSDDQDHEQQLPAPEKGRRRGRQPKYKSVSLVCYVCNKKMSSRQAVISHLYTQHNVCVPGTEKFHDLRKLRKRRIHKQRLKSHTEEYIAGDLAHKMTENTKQEVSGDSNTRDSEMCQRRSKRNLETKSDFCSNLNREEDQGMVKSGDGGTSDPDFSPKKTTKRKGRERKRKRVDDEGRLCEVCGASFADRKQLYVHRPHCQSIVCQLCGKNVKRIKTHMMRHLENRRFQCPQCPKSFPFRTNLQQHLIYHSDERPHVCEVCGMRYREKARLNDHLRTHTGSKPYKCTLCDAAFTRSRGLKDHQRVHTGEKPYGCQVCGRQFSSTGNLAAHRRKVHKLEPLPCNYNPDKNTLRRLVQARLLESQQQHIVFDADSTLNEVKVNFDEACARSSQDLQQNDAGVTSSELNEMKFGLNNAHGIMVTEYTADMASSQQVSESVAMSHYTLFTGQTL